MCLELSGRPLCTVTAVSILESPSLPTFGVDGVGDLHKLEISKGEIEKNNVLYACFKLN